MHLGQGSRPKFLAVTRRVGPPAAAAVEEANTRRTVSGLKWIVKRTSATTHLKLVLALYMEYVSSADTNPLVATFSDVAQLSNLRCLSLLESIQSILCTERALAQFSVCLLERAPRLEALHLRVKTPHFPPSNISFQHLRHLVVTSADLHSNFLVAKQLPALETLLLVRKKGCKLKLLDMSGCKRLRRLVLSDVVAEEWIWDATSLGPCPLVLDLGVSPDLSDAEACGNALHSEAASAQQLSMGAPFASETQRGILGEFLLVRVLDMDWPLAFQDQYYDDMGVNDSNGKRLGRLAWCMPPNKQPLLNLTTIVITAGSMHATFPEASQLPNLKELVIAALGRLDLHFEDPIGTLSGLTSLHVFGQPLATVPSQEALTRLMATSRALEKHGLVLGAAAAQQDGCLYLRLVGAPELTIDVLRAETTQLVQCRCGACFGCLQRAGCIEG